MKVFSRQLAAPALVLAIAFSTASRAQDSTGSDFPRQSLQAKIQYCKTCHGLAGQGYRGFYAMPRLAGQQTLYFVNQLKAFADRSRKNQYMYVVARTLPRSMMSSLATHFSGLNPKPLGGTRRSLAADGRKIYEEGVPESNVPACMACHGPAAKGQGEIPRLAGQLPDYVADTLANWGKARGQGSGSDASALMLPTSHSLTRPQVAAVAAYVSSLQ